MSPLAWAPRFLAVARPSISWKNKSRVEEKLALDASSLAELSSSVCDAVGAKQQQRSAWHFCTTWTSSRSSSSHFSVFVEPKCRLQHNVKHVSCNVSDRSTLGLLTATWNIWKVWKEPFFKVKVHLKSGCLLLVCPTSTSSPKEHQGYLVSSCAIMRLVESEIGS